MTGPQPPFNSVHKLTERLDVDFALQAVGLGVWELDPLSNNINWDDHCRELFGLSRDSQLTYEQGIQYVHTDDQTRVNEAVQWAMNPESGGGYDITFRTLGADDGKLRWVRFQGRSYFTETGAVYRFAGVAQEVTQTVLDRQQAESTVQQLRASEAQLRSLIENTPDVITRWSKDRTLLFANSAFATRMGVENSFLLGKTNLQMGQPEGIAQPYMDQLQAVLTSGQPRKHYTEFITPQGLVYLESRLIPELAADGSVQSVLAIARDITSLKASEERFRSLIDEAPVAMGLHVGADLRIEIANDSLLNYWGKDKSVLGKPFSEAVPELAGQGFFEILQTVFTTGEAYQAKGVSAHLNNGEVTGTYYFDVSFNPLRKASGEVYAVLNTAVDVTEQLLNRQQELEIESRFRSLIEEAPVATGLYIGRELIIEVANERILDIWGKGGTVLGKPLAQALPELQNQPFLQILDDIYTTGETYQAAADRCDLVVGGQLRTFYFNFTYKPLRDASGDVYAIMNMAVDVTQQVLARQQVDESELRYRSLAGKLEKQVQERTEELAAINEELTVTNEELSANNEEYAAINENLTESTELLIRSNDNLQKFAYIASHDLQEPLRKIQAFGDILKERYADQLGEGVDYLNRMQVASSRMSTLIRDLLAYSRVATQRDTSTLVSLTQVVQTVLTDLDLRIQETGAIVTLDPLPTIVGDSTQLGQLFLNLIGNALKFQQPDSPPRIQVTNRKVSADRLPAGVRPARISAAYHRIDVADNGIGFDEKYLDRIFEVFQRLHGKSQYAGTGIGLAICEKVVTNHGGAITAISQPSLGATFSIFLPV